MGDGDRLRAQLAAGSFPFLPAGPAEKGLRLEKGKCPFLRYRFYILLPSETQAVCVPGRQI